MIQINARMRPLLGGIQKIVTEELVIFTTKMDDPMKEFEECFLCGGTGESDWCECQEAIGKTICDCPTPHYLPCEECGGDGILTDEDE